MSRRKEYELELSGLAAHRSPSNSTTGSTSPIVNPRSVPVLLPVYSRKGNHLVSTPRRVWRRQPAPHGRTWTSRQRQGPVRKYKSSLGNISGCQLEGAGCIGDGSFVRGTTPILAASTPASARHISLTASTDETFAAVTSSTDRYNGDFCTASLTGQFSPQGRMREQSAGLESGLLRCHGDGFSRPPQRRQVDCRSHRRPLNGQLGTGTCQSPARSNLIIYNV